MCVCGNGGGGTRCVSISCSLPAAAALTTSGERFLKCVFAGNTQHLHYLQRSGSYWLANAASLRHQAIHVPVRPERLLQIGDLQNVTFSVEGFLCFARWLPQPVRFWLPQPSILIIILGRDKRAHPKTIRRFGCLRRLAC